MNKMTKKLGTLAMATAILGTGITAAYVAETPKAEASAVIMDDFDGKGFYTSGLSNVEQTLQVNEPSHVHGESVFFNRLPDGGTIKHVKIYLHKPGVELQRFKTITEWTTYNGWLDFQTKLTTGFPKGEYVAVLTTSKGQYRTPFWTIK